MHGIVQTYCWNMGPYLQSRIKYESWQQGKGDVTFVAPHIIGWDHDLVIWDNKKQGHLFCLSCDDQLRDI